MAKKNDTPTGWQPIEVPVTDQTALPGFATIEVTPVPAAPAPEPAAPAKPTPPAATTPATKSKES